MRERAAPIGGSLEVTSAPGTGTTVRLHTPAAKGGDSRVEHETIRVLVVEDHHVVRQGLVALLNVAGWY